MNFKIYYYVHRSLVNPVIEDIENFISDYDKRINEAVLGVDEESEK